jgi:RimJ/RimL family protein N-acetyltransferase
MSDTVRLRKASAADAYALWVWANDPETRKASRGRDVISWPAHVAWLDSALRDAGRRLFIATTAEHQPAGSVRFDSRDGWATAVLSFVLAPEARSRRLGTPLIVAGLEALRQEHPRVTVFGEVVRDNDRSIRVFQRAGWTEETTRGTARELVFRAPNSRE